MNVNGSPMAPGQALQIVVAAAEQAPLNKLGHIQVEQAVAVLAEIIRAVEQPVEESEEFTP